MKKFRPNIAKNIILILIIITFLFLINYYQKTITEQSENSNTVTIGGSFDLIDENENIVSSEKIEKFKIIYFGYTFCPDVCPFDILKLSNFFSKNKDLIKYIQPIFITVDPERDTPIILKNFLENFNQHIIGLTGSQTMVEDTLKKFKVYKKISSNENESMNYLIDHTSLFYIVDKKDKYITHLSSKNFEEDFDKFIKKNFY